MCTACLYWSCDGYLKESQVRFMLVCVYLLHYCVSHCRFYFECVHFLWVVPYFMLRCAVCSIFIQVSRLFVYYEVSVYMIWIFAIHSSTRTFIHKLSRKVLPHRNVSLDSRCPLTSLLDCLRSYSNVIMNILYCHKGVCCFRPLMLYNIAIYLQ